MASLPAGAAVRPMRLDDAGPLQKHLSGYSLALIGAHQYSLEGVADFLRTPALELDSDTWLVSIGDAIAGTAAVMQRTDSIGIEVISADSAVAGWLLDRAIVRATERTREAGADESILRFGMLGQDQAMATLAADRGFARTTSMQRMKVLHAGPVDPPAVPEGIEIRRGAPDDASRRTAHRLVVESFAEQPSASPPGYDDWAKTREARSAFDWSQLTVLELDGDPVAVREWDTNFVNSDGCGYIGRIGVLPRARGRGLAKYLLLDQFSIDAAAGLNGTLLHVNSSNPTPAVGLYLSVGMRPDIVNDIWQRTLRI
jgi:ribosomal protein S18 acetylase RimI-like enzyme